jgi:3-oxoacyl-[acyl-carrier protein] reductase
MPRNRLSFAGRTALVTGGTRGIGLSIATELSALGADVIVTGTSEPAGDLPCRHMKLDLGDEGSIAGFMEELQKVQRIDVLINNAGINIIEPVYKIDLAHWDSVLKVNLTGAMLLIRNISSKMISNASGGRILNVSSIYGVVSRQMRANYSSSKFGLIGLTRASALDLAQYNILVNALCPGFTSTELTMRIVPEKDRQALAARIPLGRFAEPAEIAAAAVFLCSDMNTFMTGQTVIVDGGYLSQ